MSAFTASQLREANDFLYTKKLAPYRFFCVICSGFKTGDRVLLPPDSEIYKNTKTVGHFCMHHLDKETGK
jgi:hypothetical protein